MPSTAISISASQQWAGNDGTWSTFPIDVGTPAATLFLLPATSKRSTWVVNQAGCQQRDGSTCRENRGGVFDPANSTSWRNLTADGEYFYLNFAQEAPLNALLPQYSNYNSSSFDGTDTLTFGFPGKDDPLPPTLENQLIVTYDADVPYLGLLGLARYNETIESYGDTHSSVLGALSKAGAIPSPYWAYTAGAHYRNAIGSLTFGGYDANRGNVHQVAKIPLAAQSDRDLLINITKITISGDASQSVAQPIQVLIDSVVPEIWLPPSACQAFEDAFGLVWNDTVSMYLVNDSQHDRLTDEKPSVTFSLAAPSNAAEQTDITLPYAAFDLTVGYPLLQNMTNDSSTTKRYFPLKRATDNATQYFLGRTFLQEAHLAVDYDKGEFYVSPARFDNTQKLQLKTVRGNNAGLSAGAIAGIVVGALAALAMTGALIWWFCFGKKRNAKNSSRKSGGTSSIGGTTIDAWFDQVPPGHVEQYKPGMSEIGGEEQDIFKPELDATTTARGVFGFHRHELSAGTIRRASDQSRASISPLEERRRGHNRNSSFGVPSPPSADQVGMPSPHLSGTPGHPSPPMSESMGAFGGSVPTSTQYFELHGRSRDSPASPSTPAPAGPEQALLSTSDQRTLDRLEGSRS